MPSPFIALIGQLVWQVRRGVGTFLTMEFGQPHLSVREPIEPRHSTAPRVRRDLRRRRVSLAGDWHLWIQHADWKIDAANASLRSDDEPDAGRDEVLRDLDGQKLLSAEVDPAGKWTLRFDLGATVEIWPARYDADELWSLHPWQGDAIVWHRGRAQPQS